ncbi:hypothetical protein CDJ04_13925 [Salmonella enterica]|uniref:Uncharacterized protein n=1 Tax=Salmonella enterica subsp. enterica serovar Ank TaxID=1173578 RepID=A0A5I2X3Q0_SALET|nr:hypothetical protein [Salmonella enterica]EBQ9003028.1 hypothetical protein [Salmonella enterica subsp. enterica serovar Blockley]EBR0040708.1 hypothetical protein [Salmonella enterica subsp. enterica serovar Oranienburg]EBU8700358.1 hypothetical protein [Salmonella enterica subsp. enterica serovar Kokomlemle]EBV7249302.1 hypothetical protein [Salmonella enterica subsp. enterica serovar Pomona]EBZ5138238.1 hypothetical protein [Salmonella enterica subsp. enterica serovar Antsalova]ECD61611
MYQQNENSITVGILLDLLQSYPRDAVLYFGGLDFYRLKWRDENLLQVEFNQLVYRNSDGLVVIENLGSSNSSE